MADQVQIDDAAIAAEWADWDSDVGRYIARLTEEAEDTARILAPVSSRGSRYAPPGTLKRQIHSVYSHGDSGSVMGLVGVSRTATRGYPLNFVASSSGKRRISNQTHRLFGYTRANNYFLAETATTLFGPATSMFTTGSAF